MRYFILVFTACVMFAMPAAARDKTLDIQEVVSPGGIKAWLVEDHAVPVIAMNMGFKGAGALLDPADKQGLSRMLSNTMDEGAGEIDSAHFQQELQDLSISLHFGSDRDNFSATLKTLSTNKARAFELMTLALTKPRFDAEPVGRMRDANLSRVRSSLSNPEWLAARLLNDRAFAGHAYAQNSGGTLTTLANITPEDLRAFHKAHIGKNNLVVAVAGDITKDELMKVLDSMFGALPDVATPAVQELSALQNTGGVHVFTMDTPQTVIEITQPGISRKDPDYFTAQVMNFILGSSGFGSRLMDEIREKRGLTYGIYSSYVNLNYFDGLNVSTSTENKNAGEVITLINAEWKKMKETAPSAQEIEDAKNYLIGVIPLSLTSTDDISGMMLGLLIEDMPIDYLDQREAAIRAATAADVQRVAQKMLDETQMVAAMVGKPEGVKDVKPATEIPNAE